MSEARYDIRFHGQLVPGTDPLQARERLQAAFKLSDSAAARLFSGQAVTVKRDLDSETVARYRERFRAAGALIEAVPTAPPARQDPNHAPAQGTTSGPYESSASPEAAGTAPGTSSLSLAPTGGWLEELRETPPPNVDISYLSLVPGDDWTLEDCSPPPSETRIPDISHLRLVPLPPREEAVEA